MRTAQQGVATHDGKSIGKNGGDIGKGECSRETARPGRHGERTPWRRHASPRRRSFRFCRVRQVESPRCARLEGFLPSSKGSWEGEKGDSIWKPDPDCVPLKSNPEGKTWEEIEDKYGIDGVKFKDGEPDFSEVAEATVEIDDFTGNRFENFAQADSRLAEKWNAEGRDGRTDWTARDVAAYRKENSLTWHERSDMKTMDLVPSEVHNNIPHAGGISAWKQG